MSSNNLEMSSSHIISKCKLSFSKFDKQGKGIISASDLGNVMQDVDKSYSNKGINAIIPELDPKNTGNIKLSVFLKYMTKQDLGYNECIPLNENEVDKNRRILVERIFKEFDINKTGYMLTKLISIFFVKCGLILDKSKCNEIENSLDPKMTGYIHVSDIIEWVKNQNLKIKERNGRKIYYIEDQGYYYYSKIDYMVICKIICAVIFLIMGCGFMYFCYFEVSCENREGCHKNSEKLENSSLCGKHDCICFTEQDIECESDNKLYCILAAISYIFFFLIFASILYNICRSGKGNVNSENA